MKMVWRAVALVSWVLAGTILLSRWWYANSDYFPRLSPSFWYGLDQLCGVTNVDGARNIEFFFVVMTAFFAVGAVSMAIIVIASFAKRHL